jgi:tetratricopeptide (TPR) repeat protein
MSDINVGSRKSRVATVASLWSIALLLGLSGCGSDGPVEQTPDYGAPQLVSAGWTFFEQGLYSSAEERFSQALSADPSSAAARAGLGWSRLRLGRADEAVQAFDAALSSGSTDANVLGGHAAARLAEGVTGAVDAEISARAALVASPNFVFQHDPRFGARELRKIVVISLLMQGDLDTALAEGDSFLQNDLDPGDPASWVVQGLRFDNFSAAAVAHLESALQFE